MFIFERLLGDMVYIGNYSYMVKTNSINIIFISILLNLIVANTAGANNIEKLIPPLNERDFSSNVKCPKNLNVQECYKYRKKYSTVNCPQGKSTYAGFITSDSSFQVFCGNNIKGQHMRKISCPPNSSIRTDVRSSSQIFGIRCDNQKSEFNGPFFEWYTEHGKLQSILSGHYRNYRPVGYFYREDANGVIYSIYEVEHEENSINYLNAAGEQLRWDYSKKKWKRTYTERGIEYRH